MLSSRCRLVKYIGSSFWARCSSSSTAWRSMMMSTGDSDAVEQEYQRAVQALNGLQTSAEALERKRSCGEEKASKTASLAEQWRLDEHHHREPRAKLLHTKEYLERSGIVQQLSDLDRLNAIHVTGTKGKGSVCAMCESILRRHGLKTGFFSSPHLLEVRERIRLNGVPLSKSQFVSYFWECYDMLKKIEKMSLPTYFKFLTVMSFHVFLKEKVDFALKCGVQVDVAVVEVGIGGAFDCTNIMPRPAVSGISSLGYDHMEILGDTLEKIAWQKGGIFKPDCPAFTSPQFPSPMRVLAERAKELKASSLLVAPPLQDYPSLSSAPLKLSLAGAHQQANASLAVQLCRSWLKSRGKWTQDSEGNSDFSKQLHGVDMARPFLLTQEFREGLEQCWWPGRNQVIKRGRVTYYLDGAHTPQSLKACADWFSTEASEEAKDLKCSPVRVLLFNITKKRDPKLLLQALLDCGFKYAAFSPNIAHPQGTNSADQTNLTVTVDSQCARARENHHAWLIVNHCLQPAEPIHASLQRKWEGLPTTAPDPLSLCVGVASGGGGGMADRNFKDENACVFKCISDVVRWCGGNQNLQSAGAPPLPAPPPDLAAAAHIQILVTGSLHLVGATMSVLGCKVEDL